MERLFLTLGALSALISVAAGAFAAHALRTRLPTESLLIFETAARYQMYHALGLMAVAWAASRWPGTLPRMAGWLFVIGTVLFSGSLYALALTGTSGLVPLLRWAGPLSLLDGYALLWLLKLDDRGKETGPSTLGLTAATRPSHQRPLHRLPLTLSLTRLPLPI
jgi:uncharacterized membrane protein YgdD (TMEM256/DUF423 family)